MIGLVSRVIELPTDVDNVAIELAREIARFPATTGMKEKKFMD